MFNRTPVHEIPDSPAVANTIRALARPGMKPKALIEAVKERHPAATKKEIARAAFLSVIMSAEFDPEDAQTLHDLAAETRDETD